MTVEEFIKKTSLTAYSALSMTAIVRGTVLYGLSLNQDIHSVATRTARFSYGVSVSEHFVSGTHSISKMYYDPFYGELMCPGRMRWFVRKVRLPSPCNGRVANIFL